MNLGAVWSGRELVTKVEVKVQTSRRQHNRHYRGRLFGEPSPFDKPLLGFWLRRDLVW